jgi:hypothetical protein
VRALLKFSKASNFLFPSLLHVDFSCLGLLSLASDGDSLELVAIMASHSFTNTEGKIKKRSLRNGTRSCFECNYFSLSLSYHYFTDSSAVGYRRLTYFLGRKRKSKCTFLPEHFSRCTECYGRGIPCVDQEYVDALSVPQRGQTVRDRLSHLELMMEAVQKELKLKSLIPESTGHDEAGATVSGPLQNHDKPSKKMTTAISTDQNPDNSCQEFSRISPVSTASYESMTSVKGGWDTSSTQQPFWANSLIEFACLSNKDLKDFRVHQALASVISKNTDLEANIDKSQPSWNGFRMLGTKKAATFTSFGDFIRYAQSSGSPVDIAVAIQTLALTAESQFVDQVTFMVDRLIIADDDYMASMEGIRCALLQGNIYSESGQIVPSFKAWRRAILQAQLMGFHKNRPTPEHERVWWALYTVDRFASLQLGIPYAVPDYQCNMSFRGEHLGHHFGETFQSQLTYLGRIAGKITDHSLKHGENGRNERDEVAQLDQELAQISAQLPSDTWITNEAPSDDDVTKARQWRQQVLILLAYYELFFALHFPYMLKSVSDTRYAPFRDRCLRVAQKFLVVYKKLRHRSKGSTLLPRVKSFDAVGCAATMVLILGLHGFGRTGTKNDFESAYYENLVKSSLETYEAVSTEAGEKAASESYRVLKQFMQSQQQPITDALASTKISFTVPFFKNASFSYTQTVVTRGNVPRPLSSHGWQSVTSPENIPSAVAVSTNGQRAMDTLEGLWSSLLESWHDYAGQSLFIPPRDDVFALPSAEFC